MWRILFGILISIFFIHNACANNEVQYEDYMKELITLSKQNPRYPFAAMIIDNKTGKMLCAGVNTEGNNPTFHGEIVAIGHCAAKYPKLNWSGTTLLTTAEPCTMCAAAIALAGISKIVYGTSIAFLLEHGWHQIKLDSKTVIKHAPFRKIAVVGGVLHEKTDKLFTNTECKRA